MTEPVLEAGRGDACVVARDEGPRVQPGEAARVNVGSHLSRVVDRLQEAPGELVEAERFRARKLDGAVLWEPTVSRLVLEKIARKVLTGASAGVNEIDGGFLVMPRALIDQRPDIVKGWLEGELDAQLFFADGKNAMAVSAMALEQTTGFTQKALWYSAYGTYPKSEGGTATRIVLPYAFTPEARELIAKAAKPEVNSDWTWPSCQPVTA